jgi:hypothetical protein
MNLVVSGPNRGAMEIVAIKQVAASQRFKRTDAHAADRVGGR